MLIKMFKSKIHRATITGADLNYEGSVKISGDLLDAAKIREFESINIWNITNGQRLMTYVLRGENNSGIIELNGAAARCAAIGDVCVLSTFADMFPDEADNHKPTVVLVDANNKITNITNKSGGMT